MHIDHQPPTSPRHHLSRCVLAKLGTYVFEPTGAIFDIKQEVARRYRSACEQSGRQVAPCELPR